MVLPGKLADCSIDEPGPHRAVSGRGRLGRRIGQTGARPAVPGHPPLRGKILNVERARIDKILSNEEIRAMITAIGTGVKDDFTARRRRYHKIILMTDADVTAPTSGPCC